MRPWPNRAIRSALVLLVSTLLAALVTVPVTADAATAPRYTVTLFASANLTLGQSLPIKGRVSPSARGRYVYVEARKPGIRVWQTMRAIMVRKGGRYAATLHPNQPGLWRYRVMKPAGNGYRRGYSVVRKVTVSRWRTLESMLVEYAEAAGTTPVAGVTLGGVEYRPGYTQDPAGSRFFALGRRCSRIDLWVGADPESVTETNLTGAVRGSVAGSPSIFDRALATPLVRRDGAPAHVVLGPDRISAIVNLVIRFDGGAEGDRLLWGRPLAYCSF